MSAGAELLEQEASHELSLSSRLIDCDAIAELADQRRQFFDQGNSLLETNNNLLSQAGPEAVPLAIDVLGTARTLYRIGYQHGEESQLFEEGERGLALDSSRLIAEARRKNKWEYFPAVRHSREPMSGRYYVNGFDGQQVVVNGLSPLAKSGEQTIRVQDYVEQRTKEAIGATNLAAEEIAMVTIKPCPDYIIEDFKQNPAGGHSGYAPAVEKLFIQVEKFDIDGCDQEELAVPGIYITTQVINEVLAEAQAIVEGAELTKAEIRAKQFLSNDEDPMLLIIEALDQKASEYSSLNIFMGEAVNLDHPKDYANIRSEAIARQESQKALALEVRDLLVESEASGLDSRLASCKLDAHLKRRFFNLALEDSTVAEEVFDKQTADEILKAKVMASVGVDAKDYIGRIYTNAPATSYCGAGSCGLEAPHNSVEEAKVRSLGLTGELVYDTERACPKCSHKSVYYSLDGGKACGNCSAFES